MLSIERATTNHKESLKQCFMTIFDKSEMKYFNRIRDLSLSYVALDRNKSVKAFILVNKSNKYADYEIAYLGVSHRYRGKGYSKVLMKIVLSNLENNSIWLNTFSDNMQACRLYENLGFYPIHKTYKNEIIYFHDKGETSSPM